MTEFAARNAMVRLDLPYLQRVLSTSATSYVVLAALIVSSLEDDEIDEEEAMRLAGILLLLEVVRREAMALANVTDQASAAVSAVARQAGIAEATSLLQTIRSAVTNAPIPPPTTPAMLSEAALRVRILEAFGDDAVRLFDQAFRDNLKTMGLQTAARVALDYLFGPSTTFANIGIMPHRSMLIIRQANYDTFRPAMVEMYRVPIWDVKWWQWKSRLDSSTCAACVALHGRVFPLNRDFEHAHIRCRCMPIVLSSRADAAPTGDAWLRLETPEVQDGILGKRGGELYRAGDVVVQDFLRLRRHPIYGPSYTNGGVAWAEGKARRRTQ